MSGRNVLDPTAGETARTISEGTPVPPALADPTAGQSARLSHDEPQVPRPNGDPTDPRYGETVS